MPSIIFIGPKAPPLGGVAIINESFQRLQYDDLIVNSFNTSNGNDYEDLYKGFPWKGLYQEFIKLIKLLFFLKRENPKVINIFITSGYSILRDCFYLVCIKKKRVSIIVHFHSKKHGEFALLHKRFKVFARLINHYADRIILLSNDHYNYFTQFFHPMKCKIIENFIFYEDYDCKIELKIHDFLYVGRLSEEKGFFDLLGAVNLLQNKQKHIIINVIGLPINDKIKKQINEIIEKNNLKSSFVFHGSKFGQDKFDLFQKSKMLIFPSHFENSPLVLKEAIAAKMGIIASDIEANKLILNNRGNTIWHQIENPHSLAQAILDYLERPDHGISLCEASSFIKEYDSSIAEEAINSLIAELV